MSKSRPVVALWITSVLTLGTAASVDAALIGFNAEDGSSVTATVTATLGSDLDPPLTDVGNALGDRFITPETDSVDGSHPGNANRVASYEVTFNEAGTYDLYARLYFSPGGNPQGAVNDSMFYGNGFGSKTANSGGDWITVNGLPEAGFSPSTYFWVNLSEETGNFGEAGITFTVPGGGLTQTLQIGAREDGLRIDAFAFGTSTETFSDAQLGLAVFAVPAPAALPAGLAMLGLFAMRRRR